MAELSDVTVGCIAIAETTRALIDELARLREEGAALRSELEEWDPIADLPESVRMLVDEDARPTLPIPLVVTTAPRNATTIPAPYGYAKRVA